jgi:hypothetical protein
VPGEWLGGWGRPPVFASSLGRLGMHLRVLRCVPAGAGLARPQDFIPALKAAVYFILSIDTSTCRQVGGRTSGGARVRDPADGWRPTSPPAKRAGRAKPGR